MNKKIRNKKITILYGKSLVEKVLEDKISNNKQFLMH